MYCPGTTNEKSIYFIENPLVQRDKMKKESGHLKNKGLIFKSWKSTWCVVTSQQLNNNRIGLSLNHNRILSLNHNRISSLNHNRILSLNHNRIFSLNNKNRILPLIFQNSFSLKQYRTQLNGICFSWVEEQRLLSLIEFTPATFNTGLLSLSVYSFHR